MDQTPKLGGAKTLSVGEKATFTRVVEEKHIQLFAEVTGDDNPVHLDEEYAASTRFKGRIAHGMLSASFISTVFGTKLPGPGAIYLSQYLEFCRPVRIGEEITAEVEVVSYDTESGKYKFNTRCINAAGKVVITGWAVILYQP